MSFSTSPSPVIGVFDSGLGGLTVVKALACRAPGIPLVYFGDTARFPYGTKSAETIVRYSKENTAFLLKQGAEIIVVACNTASAVALNHLQAAFSVPVYGVIDPAAQKAVEMTKTGRIGVIGTRRTIKSKSYTKAIIGLLPEAQVTAVACPLLVSLIEEGCPSQEAQRLLLREYLRPMKRDCIDTLLLGCTHYPLMEEMIQEEMGADVSIVDPAKTCAALIAPTIPAEKGAASDYRFFASDDASRFKAIGEAFLGMKMGKVLTVSV
jgi:glutamate racemase